MWRKFNFFDKATVNDEKIINFFQEVSISCCTSGRGHIMFGDSKGSIHIMDRGLNTRQCLAFSQRVNHLKHSKPNFLIAVGDDGGEAFHDVIKIYNLDKADTKTGEFSLVNEIKIFGKHAKNLQPSPVTAIDVNQDFTCMALGLGNGTIILYQGDLARGRSQMRILPGLRDQKHITGLLFKRYGPTNQSYCLFVTTREKVFIYSITTTSNKSVSEQPTILDDETGCESGCSTSSNENDLAIATKSGVWFYKPEGKGSAFAFDGKKVMLQWFRTYLVLVSVDYNRQNNMQQTVTIYDLKHKYIAFKYSSEKMQVHYILQEWGSLFILATEGGTQVMYVLEEKDTQTKLEMLLQKNLYTIAINLVNSQQLDYAYVVEIFRKYGDHLYGKKEYDGAMVQYLMTIGRLEPSYVIRKFLDAQRIKNLTNYLEALHEKNLATADHTTLLLNCYTKLKNDKKDKLDSFIRTHSELHYDVETAIHVCRQAGYREHALLLAKKHKEHGWFIKIHIEDFPDEPHGRNYKRALRHIETLPFAAAEKYLSQFGKILVTKLPKQTTNVLIRLCTDYFALDFSETDRKLLRNVRTMRDKLLQKSKNVRRNIVLQPQMTGERVPNLDGAPSPIGNELSRTVSASRPIPRGDEEGGTRALSELFGMKRATSNRTNDPDSLYDSISQPGSYDDKEMKYPIKKVVSPSDQSRSSAEEFIHAYSSQPYWLMVFLENTIMRNSKVPPASKVVYNTLIELYLQYLNVDRNTHIRENNHDNDEDNNPKSNTTEWDSQYADMFLEESQEQPQTQPQPQQPNIIQPSPPTREQPVNLPRLSALQSTNYDIEAPDEQFDQLSYKEKILELLENPDSNYDTEHVLVLVQSMNFKEGVLKMYERLRLHYDIVQYYMEQRDYTNVINACNKYGDLDPNLWVQVLSYFANAEDKDFEDEITSILQKIEKDNLLPPLLVVQILSKHPKTKLGTIKEYLTTKLQQDQMMIKEDVERIKEFQMDTRKMRKEVHSLRTSAKIFQLTTCSRCGTQLDLPAVHFMCGHSYHQRCLPDQEECPLCSKKNRDILQHKKKFDESSDQHEIFFKQLNKKSADGFSVVAEYFGRGIFNSANAMDLADDDEEDDEASN
jgi:hypothetical protein